MSGEEKRGEEERARQEWKAQERRWGVAWVLGSSPVPPKTPFSSVAHHTLPFLGTCFAPALGIGLVYTAHYSGFAVAIATTRGQFTESRKS